MSRSARHRLCVCVVIGGIMMCAAARAVDAPGAVAPATRPAGSPSQLSIFRIMTEQIERRAKDPIGYFVMDLKDLTDLLAQLNTRTPTQPKQEQFIGRLDELIAMLEKQTSGGGGGTNPNPTRPLADSKIVKGPGGAGPMHDPAAGTRTWGQLPAKEREQILQSQNEGFPAGYESILSSYYRRLAQESVQPGANANTPPPTTQP